MNKEMFKPALEALFATKDLLAFINDILTVVFNYVLTK